MHYGEGVGGFEAGVGGARSWLAGLTPSALSSGAPFLGGSAFVAVVVASKLSESVPEASSGEKSCLDGRTRARSIAKHESNAM